MAEPDSNECGYLKGNKDLTQEAVDFLNEGEPTKCKVLTDCSQTLQKLSAKSNQLQFELDEATSDPNVMTEIFLGLEFNDFIKEKFLDPNGGITLFKNFDFDFQDNQTNFDNNFREVRALREAKLGKRSPEGSPASFKFKKNYKEFFLVIGPTLTQIKNDEFTNPEAKRVAGEIQSIFAQLNSLYQSSEKCAESVYNIGLEFQSRVQSAYVEELGDRDFQARIASGDQDAIDEAKELIAEQREAGADALGGVALIDKAIYQEQCFLLSQLTSLVDFKRKNHIPRLAYTDSTIKTKVSPPLEANDLPVNSNAPILVLDEPFGFMSRMTQVAHSRNLFNLSTDKLSSLVPTIRLYKVETSSKTGKDLGYVEIKFDTNPAEKSYVGQQSALDLFKNSNKRGVGVGLKSFDFTLHGSDPFAAKKAIVAKMSIFATSFGDLIADRQGEYKTISKDAQESLPISTYKFADLALKTGKTPEDLRTNLTSIQKDNLDKLNFRLKAVLGWANPDNIELDSETKNAIYDSFININLQPTTHEFGFDEMGGVTFTINFLAYIEDYFNNPSFNIFSSPKIELNRVSRKLFYEFLNNEKCDDQSVQKIKEQDAKIIQVEKRGSLSKIIRELNYQNKILYYNLSYKQVSDFLRTGKIKGGIPQPTLDNSSSQKSISEAFKTALKDVNTDDKAALNTLKVSLVSTSRESNKISFFYISDLIDLILQNIDNSLKEITDRLNADSRKALNYYETISEFGLTFSDSQIAETMNQFLDRGTDSMNVNKEIEKLLKSREQFKKLRIVLGPMEIKDPFNANKMRFCSIGDVPISINYFIEFLTKKVLSKEQAYYPITNFVKDVVSDLVKNFVNNDSCFSFNTKQRVQVNSSVISSFARGDAGQRNGEDDLTYLIRKYPTTHGKGGIFRVQSATADGFKPVLQLAGPSRDPVHLLQPDREFNYYIFYAGRVYPVEEMTGNEEVDAENGIFHYILGKDRGLVKNISLERTDMTGLKELRFEQEGYDGLTQLREVYNANIDCFLNTHTFPGTYIYVDPRGFSPEAGFDYTQFGIGGYYMITRTEHSIGPGKADTRIISKWVADANGNNTKNNRIKKKEETGSEDLRTPRKCFAEKRKATWADRFEKELVVDSVSDAAIMLLNPGFFVAKAAYAASNSEDE